MLKYKEIIDQMTLQEKAGLCSGADFWHTKAVERLGINGIMVCDGPHGLRKQNSENKEVGIGNSYPATCFPTAATTACSWDRDLLKEMGEALGDECRKENVSVILGPGVNMKRSPLCGRNFEYFSEDPLLAGELASALIDGVQSKGIGTSLKHFAGNSQETRRMTVSSEIDERALREIYLSAFEIAVKKSKPWTVMNAYNKVNGEHCAENNHLQNEILRDEWGFDGVVVSDWGAVNNRVKGLQNGNDLEMPSSGGYNDQKIVNAVNTGQLDEAVLDKSVDRILDLIKKSAALPKENYTVDYTKHHELARKAAGKSMVLLKNDNDILPLKKDGKIVAVLGELARTTRYQGAGSSIINPTHLDNAYTALRAKGLNVRFAPGYNLMGSKGENEKIEEAVRLAEHADTVIIFAGLTEDYESEGFDRSHLRLPSGQTALIREVIKKNKDVIVVLAGGSVVELPWFNSVSAVLHSYLGGQAGALAVADILMGDVNPSGKLAETYPMHLEENPSYKNFPGNKFSVQHRESIYIGYRYYNTFNKRVQFPFGYGLSYTEFEYSSLKLSKKKIKDTDELKVTFSVKNVGKVFGEESVQLYVSDEQSTIFRPSIELKGFDKVALEPGEKKTVEITLDKRAFAYYNVNISDWHVESGKFNILICASSDDIRLSEEVTVESTQNDVEIPDYRNTAPIYYDGDPANATQENFVAILGRDVTKFDENARLSFVNNLEDAERYKWGNRIYKTIDKVAKMTQKGPNGRMMAAVAVQTPIRNFVSMSNGLFSPEMADGLLMVLSDEAPGKGAVQIVKGVPNALKNLKTFIKSI